MALGVNPGSVVALVVIAREAAAVVERARVVADEDVNAELIKVNKNTNDKYHERSLNYAKR
jgi:hypothetical protein